MVRRFPWAVPKILSRVYSPAIWIVNRRLVLLAIYVSKAGRRCDQNSVTSTDQDPNSIGISPSDPSVSRTASVAGKQDRHPVTDHSDTPGASSEVLLHERDLQRGLECRNWIESVISECCLQVRQGDLSRLGRRGVRRPTQREK